jgi:hypothetical protein
MTLTNGGNIASETSATGNGGNLIVTVPGTLSISGTDNVERLAGGLYTSTELGSKGDAGNIYVTTGRLNISNFGEINSRSEPGSSGTAGSIDIDVAETAHLTNGSIAATARATDGGNITLAADSVQLMRRSEINTSVAGNDPQTQGGNVTVNGGSLLLQDGSQVTARATQGTGGVITVNSEVFLHDGPVANVLNASSDTRGNDGTVEVNSPETDIAGSITRLPVSFLNAAALLSERCAARTAENISSVLVVGRGGTPPNPIIIG